MDLQGFASDCKVWMYFFSLFSNHTYLLQFLVLLTEKLLANLAGDSVTPSIGKYSKNLFSMALRFNDWLKTPGSVASVVIFGLQ